MRIQIDVIVWRGSLAESRHRIQAVACDTEGRVAAATADAGLVTSLRSAAKPFQLLPLVERGHAERWGWSDEQLAVMTASHTGSPRHVEIVRGILERIGLFESHLVCGYHDPLDETSLALVRERPELRTAIYNNCSGKHAGMLCLALSEGWPVAGYGRPGHPLQELMRRTVAELCGLEPEALGVAVDGCNVCVFFLPLAAMARGYARLVEARRDGTPRERALARIRDAMMAFPDVVGGAGRSSTELMTAVPGRLLAKGGAEGLECMGLLDRGLGVAIRCEDGAMRAVGPATVAMLEHLDALGPAERTRLASLARPAVTNTAGVEVGTIAATVRIVEATASPSQA